MQNKWLIVGLGNPINNQQYINTRHNIGVKAVQYMAGNVNWQKKFKGLTATVLNADTQYIYLLPQTFMNLSGESVQAAATFHKILPENIIVLHDEIELTTAKLRIKQGGGHAGHNGLKSIDKHLGKNYFRLRVGIDKPPAEIIAHNPNVVADYVLSNFSKQELTALENKFQIIDDCIDSIISDGLTAAQQVLAL